MWEVRRLWELGANLLPTSCHLEPPYFQASFKVLRKPGVDNPAAILHFCQTFTSSNKLTMKTVAKSSKFVLTG